MLSTPILVPNMCIYIPYQTHGFFGVLNMNGGRDHWNRTGRILDCGIPLD